MANVVISGIIWALVLFAIGLWTWALVQLAIFGMNLPRRTK